MISSARKRWQSNGAALAECTNNTDIESEAPMWPKIIIWAIITNLNNNSNSYCG